MEKFFGSDGMFQLLNTGIATFFSIVLLYVVIKAIPVVSQIKMLMIQLLEVLNNLKPIMTDVKDQLEYFKHIKE